MLTTHEYPYTNFHELNADWIVDELKKLIDKVDSLDVQITKEQVEQIFEDLDTLKTKMALIPTPAIPEDVDKFMRVSARGGYYLDRLTDVANEGA